MKPYTAYAIGAALVDTEIQVTDAEMVAMNVEKGMMTPAALGGIKIDIKKPFRAGMK